MAASANTLGVVASVRTRAYTDGVRQDIALQGGAIRSITNGITVLIRTSRQPTLDESVPLVKPSESAIRSEIGAQFPHIPMQVVERQSSNTYGSYGLALGRAAKNVHCLYMWQWIDANRLPAEADLSGPASLRVRICRADITFDAMAAAMDQLVIGREAATSTPERVVSTDADRIIVADPAAVVPDAETDATLAKTRLRNHHAAKRKHAKTTRIAPDGGNDASTDEPRFMSSTTMTAGSRPQQQAMAPAAPPLAADLPPQAYLGPKAAQQTPVYRPN